MSLSFLGAGLISPKLIGSFALVIVVLGGALAQRQCTVNDLEEKVDLYKGRVKADGERIEKLTAQRDDAVRINTELNTANQQLASACEKQSQMNTQFAAAMEQQAQDAKAQAARHADEIKREKTINAWLSDLVKRQPALKPGECEAAAAVNEVRKVLRGQASLEVRQ